MSPRVYLTFFILLEGITLINIHSIDFHSLIVESHAFSCYF